MRAREHESTRAWAQESMRASCAGKAPRHQPRLALPNVLALMLKCSHALGLSCSHALGSHAFGLSGSHANSLSCSRTVMLSCVHALRALTLSVVILSWSHAVMLSGSHGFVLRCGSLAPGCWQLECLLGLPVSPLGSVPTPR